jgi:LuxR family maltose regulon positive regulatory protein
MGLVYLGTSAQIQSLQGLDNIPIDPIPAFLITLVNTLFRLKRDVYIVFDDYHVINAPEVHDAVMFLMNNQPENLKLIISTRTDPPLRLAQLRARGELCEIRASDLRFNNAEADLFLNNRMNLAVAEGYVEILLKRTEGWIAGLQLAGISLQKQYDPQGYISNFAGDDRYVMDYLMDEVLANLDEDVRRFLLFTSPFDRFCASLCDQILGWERGKSRQIIDFIDQSNLFVIPLDNRREWYRYHHLFASLLHHRLRSSRNALIADLHGIASNWYEEEGQINPALQHAILSGDIDLVSSLVEKYVFTVSKRGDRLVFTQWVSQLKSVELKKSPWICIAAAWALTDTGYFDDAEYYLKMVEEFQPRSRRLGCHIAAVRANQASLLEDHGRMTEFSQRALEAIETKDDQLRGMLTLYQAKATFWSGDMAGSEEALKQAYLFSKSSGDINRAVITLADVGEVQMVRGKLKTAIDTVNRAFTLADESKHSKGRPMIGSAHAHSVMASIYLETGDVNTANKHNEMAYKLCEAWGHPRFTSNYYLIQSGILSQCGEIDRALESVQKAQEALTLQGKTIVQEETFTTYKAELYLMQGDLEKTAILLDGMSINKDENISFKKRNEYRVLAGLLIAEGEFQEAIRIANQLVNICQKGEANIHVIRGQILKAKAYYLNNDLANALESLEGALDLTADEGLATQAFIDGGNPIAKLLYSASTLGIYTSFCQKILSKFPKPSKLKIHPETQLVESLSNREMDVLEQIAKGLTNQEIALSMHLSLYTVKSHARNIYGKLGVKNRTEAVARGRLLGLLSQD